MIGIIGGGISGLTLAYYLQKAGKEYVLLEASNRYGGCIHTDKDTGRELGPNTILEDEHVQALIQDLQIENDIIEANPISKDRFILKNGKIQKLPTHPLKLLTSRFFSWKTKRQILGELKKPYQAIENETIKDFFVRRFGQEVYDYAVNPFISGIYAGDPATLLIKEAFPQLVAYEKEYGSIIKGFKNNQSKARKRTLSFKKGLSYLPESIAQALDHAYLQSPVKSIEALEGKKYKIHTTQKEFVVSQLVFAIPAKATAKLLSSQYPTLSEKLQHIYYPPMTIVHTVVDRSKVKKLPQGFGVLHPKVENRFAAGTIWSSSIFPKEKESFMFTSFVGGSQYIAHATLDEEEIKTRLWKELKALHQIPEESLMEQCIYKWEYAIPQYDMALSDAVAIIPSLEKDNIYICSNWYEGISLPACIKKGKELALKLF